MQQSQSGLIGASGKKFIDDGNHGKQVRAISG
jgi:hypothetical protein